MVIYRVGCLPVIHSGGGSDGLAGKSSNCCRRKILKHNVLDSNVSVKEGAQQQVGQRAQAPRIFSNCKPAARSVESQDSDQTGCSSISD